MAKLSKIEVIYKVADIFTVHRTVLAFARRRRLTNLKRVSAAH